MTKVTDGLWWVKYEGPAEIVSVTNGFVFRHADGRRHDQHEFKFLQPVTSQEETERQTNFDRRRLAKIELGWDECGANGQSCRHQQNPYDSRYYCEYCGAEALPEDAVEIEGHKRHDKKQIGTAKTGVYGDLDFPAPNHYDPNKRGFSPK